MRIRGRSASASRFQASSMNPCLHPGKLAICRADATKCIARDAASAKHATCSSCLRRPQSRRICEPRRAARLEPTRPPAAARRQVAPFHPQGGVERDGPRSSHSTECS